jgi:hypothetical protein
MKILPIQQEPNILHNQEPTVADLSNFSRLVWKSWTLPRRLTISCFIGLRLLVLTPGICMERMVLHRRIGIVVSAEVLNGGVRLRRRGWRGKGSLFSLISSGVSHFASRSWLRWNWLGRGLRAWMNFFTVGNARSVGRREACSVSSRWCGAGLTWAIMAVDGPPSAACAENRLKNKDPAKSPHLWREFRISNSLLFLKYFTNSAPAIMLLPFNKAVEMNWLGLRTYIHWSGASKTRKVSR